MSCTIDTGYLLQVADDPEIYTRVRLVNELSEFIEDPATGRSEIDAVTPVLLRLCDDPSMVVRRTLANRVRKAARMPEEVALALAADDEDIACDVLAEFAGFGANVLIGIVRIADKPRRMAIARRRGLDARACLALVELGDEAVCRAVLGNPSVRLERACYDRIEARFGPLERFERLIMKRRDVPAMLAVRMIEAVSDRLARHARARNWLRPEQAARVVADAKEQGIMRVIARADLSTDRSVVTELFAARKITASLILRAACVGKMDFVEEALSQLARMPRKLAHNMMTARGAKGFKALYSRAGLPERLYPALRVAVDVHAELCRGAGDWDEARFGRRMVERILTRYEAFSDADKRFLLGMLKQFAAEATRPLVDQVLEDMSLAA
jgi:uncharacterized protein (DUF2336 family)